MVDKTKNYLFVCVILWGDTYLPEVYYGEPFNVYNIYLHYRYSSSERPDFDGPLTVNNYLKRSRKLFTNEIVGPEGIVTDKNGVLYFIGYVWYIFLLSNLNPVLLDIHRSNKGWNPELLLLTGYHATFFINTLFPSFHLGDIYSGLGDGRIIRVSKNLSSYVTIVRTGQPPYDGCGEHKRVLYLVL